MGDVCRHVPPSNPSGRQSVLGSQTLDERRPCLGGDAPGLADLDGLPGAGGHQLINSRAAQREQLGGFLRAVETTEIASAVATFQAESKAELSADKQS
jgi:hypothetical protein